MPSRTKMTEFMVADAISNAMSDIEGLRDEMRDWYDNMPESLQGGDKGSAIDECASTLDDVDSITVHEKLENEKDDNDKLNVGGARFMFPVATRKRMSRADRCSEATALLRAACERAREAIAAMSDEERDEEAGELEDCLDELEQFVETAEGAEFPGAYG